MKHCVQIQLPKVQTSTTTSGTIAKLSALGMRSSCNAHHGPWRKKFL